MWVAAATAGEKYFAMLKFLRPPAANRLGMFRFASETCHLLYQLVAAQLTGVTRIAHFVHFLDFPFFR